jgi:hypothetical protein
MSTGTWKSTDTTSSCTSNESVRVIRQVLLVGVLVVSQLVGVVRVIVCQSAIGGV